MKGAARKEAAPAPSPDEQELLELFRGIRRATAKAKTPIPAELFGHGLVSVDEAARLLGCSFNRVRFLLKDQWRGGWGPAGMVAISDLRREVEASRWDETRDLLLKAERFLQPEELPGRLLRAYRPGPKRVSLEEAADRLQISLKRAHELISAEVPGSLLASLDEDGEKDEWWVSEEELEAFEKAHGARVRGERITGNRAAAQ